MGWGSWDGQIGGVGGRMAKKGVMVAVYGSRRKGVLCAMR